MGQEPEVRVGVAVGREVVRAGLRALLEAHGGIAVTASFPSGDALHGWWQPLDVLVLDPLLGDGDLAGHVRHARGLGAEALALVDVLSGPLVHVLAAAGVRGVVLQDSTRQALVDAVLAVARRPARRFTVWPEASMLHDLADAGLSAGEREVLALYAAGLKADAVARAVGLSASTVTTYVSRIRRKYERAGRVASSRVDLYRRAVEDGVLPLTAGLADAG